MAVRATNPLRPNSWRALIAFGVAGCAVYFLLPSPGAQAICYLVVGGVGTGAVLVGVLQHRPDDPLPWVLLAGGHALNLTGDAVWYVDELIRQVAPFPALADAFYLASYPIMAAGLLLLVRNRTPGDVYALIDAAIVATGVGVLAWVFLMAPPAADPDLTLVERAISLAYPTASLLLVAVAARLVFAPGGGAGAWRLLLAGVAAELAADVWYAVETVSGVYVAGMALDAGWLLGHVLLGAAALHPSMPALAQPGPARPAALSAPRLALLAAASLLAPAVLVVRGVRANQLDLLVIGTASMVLFGLVLARMAGLVREVQRQAEALRALSRTDALTGIANRRVWEEVLPRALAWAARERTPVWVAILDLDHFKQFNDALGHQAGDRLLQEAAAAWDAQLRPGDLLARYGGEEFAVLLTGGGARQAVAVIERLRAATPAGVTVSAGAARWDGREHGADLVGRADAALYEAKVRGRDRAVLALRTVLPERADLPAVS